jgi:regulator of sigma E protease
MELLYQAWIVAVVVFFFGFCVFIHEFGHLLAALWRKLHVERFSVGFGKAIWKKEIKGVEYRISWIPFGGYVALPQLEPSDSIETEDGKPLPEAKPIDRIITAFAGPLFNNLFALALGTVVYFVGVNEPRRYKDFVVGTLQATYKNDEGKTVKTPEEEAELEIGDRVIAVNGITLTKGFREAVNLIVLAKEGKVVLKVIKADGTEKEISYKSVSHPDHRFQGAGIPFFRPVEPTLIKRIEEGSGAEKAGLRKGDLLFKINGKRVVDRNWVVETLGKLNPDPKEVGDHVTADFEIKRPPAGVKGPHDFSKMATISIMGVIPKYVKLTEKQKEQLRKREMDVPEARCLFGIEPFVELVPAHHTPWEQCSRVVVMTYKSIAAMFDSGNPVGIGAMSSPVGIFTKMKQMFEYGVMYGLSFVVIISMALAIFNLLPIPILDGGHIALAMMEGIARRKLPPKIIRPVFYFFFVIIISFALYLVGNDIRLKFKPDYVPPSKKGTESTESKKDKDKTTTDALPVSEAPVVPASGNDDKNGDK